MSDEVITFTSPLIFFLGAIIMSKQKITTIDQFQSVLNEQGSFLLLKHSVTCPVSRSAFEAVDHFSLNNEEIKTYYLVVQEAKPLSNYISETFQIKHESPQAFLFKDKQAIWNTSHWNITNDQLTKEVEKVK